MRLWGIMRKAQRNILLVVLFCFGMLFWGRYNRTTPIQKTIKNHSLQKRKESEKRTIIPSAPNTHDGELRLYRYRSVNIHTISEKHRVSILKHISQKTSFQKVFLRSTDHIQEMHIAELPIDSLAAIWVALEADILGLEWDMIIPVNRGDRMRTTVWIDPDGNMTVHEGVFHRAHTDRVDIQSLQKQFSIGELRSDSSSWSNKDYIVLDDVLGLLAPQELQVLQGMPIVRKKSGPHSTKTGLYTYINTYAEIQLYDNMHRSENTGFVGTPEDAYTFAHFTLMHEIAHAIANFPLLNWFVVLSEHTNQFNAKTQEINQEFNPFRRKELMTERRIIEETLKEARQQVKSLSQGSPVLSEFQKFQSFEDGPTEYANFSLGEAFAESFALFRLDPDALIRIDPKMYQWFEDEGHLQIMQAALPQERPELRYVRE